MILTVVTAYVLAERDLPGRALFLFLIVFTMVFRGGIIPTFLVVRSLGLIDTYFAMILPNAIIVFYLVVVKNYLQGIPRELQESARIDGAHELRIMFQIVLPLSMPIIATFILFYAVRYWNTFMQAVLFVNRSELWPIQVLLRQIVIISIGGIGESSSMDMSGASDVTFVGESYKSAAIVVATAPILVVYPFLHRYFVKGALVGSVKG
jgi:putative aldouronate transport system permease protein